MGNFTIPEGEVELNDHLIIRWRCGGLRGVTQPHGCSFIRGGPPNPIYGGCATQPQLGFGDLLFYSGGAPPNPR